MLGVIPRAATALFEKLDAGRPVMNNRNSMSGLRTPTRYSVNSMGSLSKPIEKNWTLHATYVEIYNEQLRDLLLPESVPQHERGAVTIREDVKGHILLTGLHKVEINSVDDLMGALNLGSMIRQTDSTAINAKSLPPPRSVLRICSRRKATSAFKRSIMATLSLSSDVC